MTYVIELSKEQEKLKEQYRLRKIREREAKLHSDLRRGFGWDQEDEQ